MPNFGIFIANFVKFSFLIAALSLISLGYSSADPISREDALAWEANVRRLHNWPADFDILAEAKQRERAARLELERNPTSRAAKRDLADALHTQGHMAEHAHDFQTAVRLHQESLKLFMESGLPTSESWDDGVAHATEHVFMDIYDHGVQVESSDPQLANRFFDFAYQWTETSHIANSSARDSSRFLPRYYALIKRRGQEGRMLSYTAVAYIGHLCQFALVSGAMRRVLGLGLERP